MVNYRTFLIGSNFIKSQSIKFTAHVMQQNSTDTVLTLLSVCGYISTGMKYAPNNEVCLISDD